jgi:hypothetical protein
LRKEHIQQHKVNDAKMMFCFANIFAEIIIHILGYSICAEHHTLAFLSNVVAIKSIKKSSRQKLLCFGTKMLVKLTLV